MAGLRAAGLPARDLAERGAAEAERRAGQVARNVKQAVLQKLGSPSEDDAIMELSEEVYFLDGAREWTLSSQTTQHVDNRTLVETSLRQPLGALREVSYQLFKGDEILASAFERRDDGPAAGGAAAAGPERGALRLRRHLQPRLAGAGRHARGDPQVLRLAGRADRCSS